MHEILDRFVEMFVTALILFFVFWFASNGLIDTVEFCLKRNMNRDLLVCLMMGIFTVITILGRTIWKWLNEPINK